MPITSLSHLYLHTLQDVLYAERRVAVALPEMQAKASDPRLKAALALQRAESEGHVDRLEAVFDSLGLPVRGRKCDAVAGLLDEACDLMAAISDDCTMDAALISVSQSVKHYKIARYGTLVSWSGLLRHRRAKQLLGLTLLEEYRADKALSQLAEGHLNAAAAAA